MKIPSCEIHTLTTGFAIGSLHKQRAFVICNAIHPGLSKRAHQAALRLFSHQAGLARVPFSFERQFGYTPPGVETVGGENSDLKRHSFDYRPGMGLRELEEFPLKALYEFLMEWGTRILEHVCEPASQACRNAMHVVRITQYMNETVDPQRESFPAHFDFGLLTLFVGNGVRGLQIDINGEWIDVVLDSGDVLVGSGLALQLYDPELRPLRHRVVASSTGRISLAAFIEPDPGLLVPRGTETFGARLIRLQTRTRN